MSVDFGYPTWDGFLDRAIREEVDDARQGELQALRAQKEFLPLAEKLDAYTNGGAGELIAAVFHESKMKPVEAPEDHYCRLLQKMGVHTYVTTNYDRVIEAHVPGIGVFLPTTLRKIEEITEQDRRRTPYLLKLHGSYERPESLVLTERQYRENYPEDASAVNPAVLRHLWQNKVLLFLGCSLEKDYMVERMEAMSRENRAVHHFAVMGLPESEAQLREKARALRHLKIRPIWYPQGQHACVRLILSLLAGRPDSGDGGGQAAPPEALPEPRLKPPSWAGIRSERDFLGRDPWLDTLEKRFQKDDLVFLSGVGGVGKSELAAQYARRQAGKGKTVVRLSYSPGQPGAEDPIEASGLRRLLLELPVLEAPAACAGPPPPGGEERLRYYQAKLFCLRRICNRDTLFVVDNFDVDWDMGMEDLQSLGAQVLLTTRQRFSGPYAVEELPCLEENDAYRLFCRHAPLGWADREEEAREILRLVGCHTTAVLLLAAQKEADGLSTGTLQNRLRRGLQQAGESQVHWLQNGMLREGTAFRLLCAVLHVAALPEEERRLLVRLAALSPGGVEGENLCRWSGCTGRDSLNRLVNLHWAERGEADRVFLTPVIARVAWETAGREAAACLPFLAAWAFWYEALPQAERYAWQDTLRAASDHGLTLLRQGAPGAMANLLHDLGRLCADQNLRPLAEIQYRKALKLYRELAKRNSSVDSPGVATTCNNLALLLSDSSTNRKEAEALYREALKLYRELAKENPSVYGPDVAMTCNNLANLLRDSSTNRKEAEDLYREVLERYQELAKGNPSVYGSDVAMTCNNLANLLSKSSAGRKEAEDLYRKALKLRRELAKENPSVYGSDVAMTCNNLAALLSDSSTDREEAEDLYREALKLRRELAKENPSVYDPDVAATCNNLATFLKASSTDREEAEDLYREALKLYRELAKGNPSVYGSGVAATCNNLANLWSDSSTNRKEAEDLYREALKLYRELAKENPSVYSPYVATTCNNLAILLKASSVDREKAEALYQEALKLRRELAKENPSVYGSDVAATCNNLAVLLSKSSAGRKEAEDLYREALKLRRELAKENPSVYGSDVAMTCNNLANLLSKSSAGRKEAEDLYREALKLCRELAKENPSVYSPYVAITCNNLANLLSKSSADREEAEDLYREALKLRRELAKESPPVYSPYVALTCNNLANLLSKSSAGRKEAEDLYREALDLYRKLANENPSVYSPYVAMTCNNLANLLSKSSADREEAKDLYREALKLRRELARENPSVYDQYVAGTCNNLANLLSESSADRKETEDLYREALKLYRKLAKENPSVYGPNVAVTCNNLALFLSKSSAGRKEAEDLYREALKLRRELAKENPSVYSSDVAMTCNNLANLLSDSSEGRKEAEALYREALERYRELTRQAPEVYGHWLAWVCRDLGDFLRSDGRQEEAQALFREADGVEEPAAAGLLG